MKVAFILHSKHIPNGVRCPRLFNGGVVEAWAEAATNSVSPSAGRPWAMPTGCGQRDCLWATDLGGDGQQDAPRTLIH